MASGVLIGAACGVGAGVLVGIVCCLIFVYFKKKNDRKERSRKRSFPPPGPNIHHPAQSPPSFQIPPIVPIPIQPTVQRHQYPSFQLSPPIVSPTVSEVSNGGSRRGSVQLGEILTSVSMIDNPPERKASGPALVKAANEPAIANLYKQQKTKARKKNQLKKSNASSALGKLEFSLFYDQTIQELQIYVVRAAQVYIPGTDGPGDLAVKAVVLFDGETVWQDKTGIAKAGSEPDFSEQLIVHDLASKKMRKATLRMIVMDDNAGQAAGEVVYPLSNLPFNQFTTETLKLTEVEDEEFGEENQAPDYGHYLGKLLISMCHNRNEKMLTVGVECAEGLPDFFRGTTDSLVKVTVMFFGKKLHSRSTKVVHKTQNPEYDERFDFNIPDDKLPQVTIHFKVKHRLKMKRDVTIGMVKLGYDADHETEYRHLEQVLEKPHLCIENWHVIRKH